VRVRLDPAAGKRVAHWSLRGIEATELDGLSTSLSESVTREPAGPHPNGVTGLVHVVAITPYL
jgi:hypothetical protein